MLVGALVVCVGGVVFVDLTRHLSAQFGLTDSDISILLSSAAAIASWWSWWKRRTWSTLAFSCMWTLQAVSAILALTGQALWAALSVQVALTTVALVLFAKERRATGVTA